MPRVPRGVALLLAVVVIAAATVYSVAWMYYAGREPVARLGVNPQHRATTGGLLLVSVEPGTPAERAGLQPGDRILEINGRRLDTPNPFYDAVTRGRPGDRVTMRVERDPDRSFTTQATLEARPPNPPQPLPRVFVLSLLRFYPAAFLIVAAAVLLQRPQDRTAWLLATLFIVLIAAAPIDGDLIHPAMRPFAFGFKMLGGLLPAAVFFFFAVFPTRSPIDLRAPWLKHVLLWPAVALIAVLVVIVGRAESLVPIRRVTEWPAWPVLGPVIILYWTVTISLGLGSLVLNDRRAPDAESRRRTRVLAWGMVLGLTPISILHTISALLDVDPYDGVPFWIWATCVLALFLIPISFAYAVVRYRVLEIPVLLKRSARYLLVQRGFVVLLFLLSAGATVVLAVELPLLLPARIRAPESFGLLAGAGLGVALAWGGARLHRRFTERIDRAFFRNAYDARRVLEHLAVRAGRAAGREELAALLARSIDEALHPASQTIYLERDSDSLEAFHGTPPSSLRQISRNLPDLDEIALEGGPVVRRPDAKPVQGFGALDALGAECLSPMIGRDERIAGLLALGPRLSEEPYSSEDRRLLATVCNQAGLALDSIWLAERIAERREAERRAAHELEIAQEVQRRLLPQQPPTLASLECAGACQQARAVGGDYYDFLDLGDGRLGLVLADISGKGISAALLMANLQAYVRSRFSLAREDLPELLRSLNAYLFESSPSSRYATLFFGRYDDTSGRLHYVNCGHNPPLVMRRDGTTCWLQPTAPVVGLVDEWSCTTGELEVRAGDTLVLYTDGVTDAMDDDGNFFEEERLVELVRRHRDMAPAALVQTLIETVTRFSGKVQEDDLTVVIAKGT
ncbi:MAG TPA: SpoIIE family protein phosphatase [Vicinamibacterales bacterium]|jgi:sigma-B regulation protein RsbU (phosphoserine phosphatase)|nr:SpoIIE family protein phosphatase [Vicinamibacterales bacterium]